MLPFLMLLCGASAFDASPRFYFTTQPRIFRRSDDICQLCYGTLDCLPFDKAQCDYKAATDAIFKDADEEEFTNDSIKKDVDIMMYDLMLKESLHEEYRECIPFISSYNDCHRGNICTGCTKCECSAEGRWNCSVVQQCRHEGTTVNHRALVLVMENLRSVTGPSNRYKRSKEAVEDKKKEIVSPEELIEWLFDGKLMPHNHVSKKPQTLREHYDEGPSEELKSITQSISEIKDEAIKNLAFDEVLSEIGVDLKINASTRNYVTEKSNASIDTEHFLEMLAIEEGKDVTKPTFNDSTVVVLDLLNGNGNIGENMINNSAIDKLNKFKDTDADLNKDMDTMGFSNFVNVMKREISTSTIPTTTRVVTKTTTSKVPISNETSNMTALEKLLRSEVLDPVTKIIDDKHKELDMLANLRSSLIKFMKVCKFNSTSYNDSQVSNDNSLYSENDNTEISNFFRRKFGKSNVVILNKYMNKLKGDINEVIRDIIGIRKYQTSNVLSKDLKVLLQAIKYYIKNNKMKLKANKKRGHKIRKHNPRRLFQSTDFDANVNHIKESLLFMLEVIDRDMPLTNALSPLSPGAKKVFKRVINNNYIDDSTVVGFRIHDQHYDMATDLKSIEEINWHEITSSIRNGAPADQLYNMLLLYFKLSQQIIKLRDALALLKFANSRRMSGIEENVGLVVIQRIDTNLNTISNEINGYINSKNNSSQNKKMSLLKKIKKLLSNSKNNMLKIMHKKQIDSDTVEYRRKRLEEANKQKYLLGWQDAFLKYPNRNKRSLREYTNQKNRMKNIIPQYLRGKVNPALNSKGKGIKKKIISYPVKSKEHTPKKNIMTSTAKTKTTVRLNKMKRRH